LSPRYRGEPGEVSNDQGCCGFIDPGLSAARDGQRQLNCTQGPIGKAAVTIPRNKAGPERAITHRLPAVWPPNPCPDGP
jgi:hypothetical protein